MTSNFPLVSILVPVYGVEKHIERCAKSLFDQTYSNLEFIFVNDASPDKSVLMLQSVIKKYPKKNKHITIFHHTKNLGLAATRNTLIANCSGEFVFHIDSDDWLEPNTIELFVKKQIETDADIVTGSFYKHEIKNGHEVISKVITTLKGKNREETLKYMLDFCSVVAIWNRLIRKSVYLNNNIKCIEGIDAGEDLMTTPRLVYYSKKVTTCDAITYHYNRTNDKSYVSLFPTSWEMQLQLINASLLNVSFFKDKEFYLQEATNIQLVKRLRRILDINFKNHCRHRYKSILDILDNTDRKYWKHIGWDNYKKRQLERHYLFFYTYRFLNTHPQIRKIINIFKPFF